jgi:hypothetical protein
MLNPGGGCEVALIVEQGFNVKRGQEEAFQKWTEETDELTKQATPAGVEYLGTYIATFSSEKRAGEYRVLWRIDSMAAFDAMEEAARDPDSDWGKINREATEFMDLPIGGEYSFVVLRPLVGAVIWDVS